MEQFQADIEHSSHKSKASFNVNLNAMMDFLGVANDGHHRERGFNHHAVIPGAFLADFDVIGNALSTAEPPVGEHTFVPIAQVIQKGVIRDVHFVPNPASDLSEGVEYPSHLKADTPPTFITALGPNLLLAAALPDRKDEFNGKTIDHIEHTGLGHQYISMPLLAPELSQQDRALRQPTEQRSVITYQPAIKGSNMPPFERKQNADGHHFTRLQLGQPMFENPQHGSIDMIKDMDDNFFRSHVSTLLWLRHLKSACFS